MIQSILPLYPARCWSRERELVVTRRELRKKLNNILGCVSNFFTRAVFELSDSCNLVFSKYVAMSTNGVSTIDTELHVLSRRSKEVPLYLYCREYLTTRYNNMMMMYLSTRTIVRDHLSNYYLQICITIVVAPARLRYKRIGNNHGVLF